MELEKIEINAIKLLFNLPIHIPTVAVLYTFGIPYSSFRPPYTDDRDFPFYIIAKDPTMPVLDQYYQLSTITRSHGSSNIRFLITDQPQDPDMDELKHEIVDYALTILVKGPKPETTDAIRDHTNRIYYIS